MITTSDSGPSVAEMIGPHLLPASCDPGESYRDRFESFIRECVVMMASSNVVVRESIKEALGTELPVSSAAILFDQLHRYVKLWISLIQIRISLSSQ